jgi:hypothetical protein
MQPASVGNERCGLARTSCSIGLRMARGEHDNQRSSTPVDRAMTWRWMALDQFVAADPRHQVADLRLF